MNPPRAFISVIIPTYSRPGPLRRCIATLASQTYPRHSFEVIVVDDGGDPPATKSLQDDVVLDLPIVLLRQPNRGAAAARAMGLAHARGPILAFLDDDCTVPPNYLEEIDRVFRDHPETQVVQVGIDNPEPDNIYGRTWKFTLEETLKVNLEPTRDGRITCGTLGGVMVARREIFGDVAFDPKLSRSREDADLRYQLQARGLPVYYEPQIRVFHHQRNTLRDYLAQFVGYGRGEFHLQRKWGATPAPYRYVTLTSWQALRSLLRAEGARSGLAIFCVLWLRRHASLSGTTYERAAWEFPRDGVFRWARFGCLLIASYANLLVQAVFALTRGPAMFRRRRGLKPSAGGCKGDQDNRLPNRPTTR